MRSRFKLLRVEHQQKFKILKEAEKEAYAVAQSIHRFVKKQQLNCKALICVSQHSIAMSMPTAIKSGKRGRPTKKFVCKSDSMKEAKKIKPHLHILLVSDEADKIALKVVSNINKRHRKRNPNSNKKVVARRYPVFNEPKYISYVMHQSTARRYVDHDPEGVLEDFDFNAEYETYKANLY